MLGPWEGVVIFCLNLDYSIIILLVKIQEFMKLFYLGVSFIIIELNTFIL